MMMHLLKRPIAYHAIVARAFGSVKVAVMWSQLYYWSDKTKDPNGWIYKSAQEMEEETGLTRRESDTARQVAMKLGVIDAEVRGTPPVMNYKVNMEKSIEVIRAYIESQTIGKVYGVPVYVKEKFVGIKEVTTHLPTPADFAKAFFSEVGEGEREEVRQWLIAKGAWSQASAQEVRKFIAYWTEPSANGKKQRWQKQPTFEVKRRIANWLDNSSKNVGHGAKVARSGMTL